jgi:DNA polymerase III subunit epsilon
MWFNSRSWSQVTRNMPDGPIRAYVVDDKPDPATPLPQARLLAVDVETTGLDPKRDQILSIGFVPVNGAQIDLSGAGHVLVRSEVEVGDSARIHGITDDALTDALTPAEALDVVFAALHGRVMICHHAAIETGFLGNACNAVHGFRPRLSVVDTLALQFRLLSQGFDDEPPQGSLRLWTARSQFGLPRYAAHNALTDALACAELYLAQAAELQASSTKALTLKSVLKY